MPTLIHQFVREANAGVNPRVIARLPSGWVMMSDDQTLRGYCLLLADPIVPDLNTLAGEQRAQFSLDMSRVGDALQAVLKPRRVNYMILGNQDHALHAHIHPRYETEEEDVRLKPPFAYALLGKTVTHFDLEREKPLMATLATELAAR